MSITTLIIGESGSGKSTSIRTLNPKETFVINVLDKPLPFKGYKKNYHSITKENLDGNYIASDDYNKIIRTIRYISDEMPNIKNVIIDDFQYVMAAEFMRRAREKGYEKFTELAQHIWEIIKEAEHSREDLYFFFLSHNELNDAGKYKFKTIGKMLDEKITVEGMFTVVLHAIIEENRYKFLTQNNSTYIAKSPMGMFLESAIDNDLNMVKENMIKYYEEDIDQ